MPDFDIINKSLKAAWAKRLSVPDCAMWKSLPLEYLRDVGGGFFSIAISQLKLFRIFLVYRYFTKTYLMHGRGWWVTLPGASMKWEMRLSGTINLLQ